MPGVASAQDTLSLPTPSASREPAVRAFAGLGVAVGTPGYGNVTVSYSFSHAALRVSGGFGGGGRMGVQGDVGWRAVHATHLAMGLTLVAGSFAARESTRDLSGGPGTLHHQLYVGAAFDFLLTSFHLQVGLAHGFRDYPPDPQLLIQFGYDFRL